MAALTGPLAAALQSRREGFNARFAMVKRELPKLDAAAVLDFLRETLAPLSESVHQIDPDAVPGVCERLYTVALPLIARDLLGPNARSPALARAWSDTLPQLAPWIIAEPERLARAVSNAVFSLENQPGARAEQWTAALIRIGPVAPSASDLLEAGLVLGWLAGLAQYRRSALEVAARLPPTLCAAALGLTDPTTVPDALARLRQSPWAYPRAPGAAEPRVQARTGGFRGLGGPFLAPPRVALADGGLVASDGHGTFTVHADRFGPALLASQAPFPAPVDPKVGAGLFARLAAALGTPQAPPDAVLHPDGALLLNGVRVQIPELAGASSWAYDGTTLAATHPMSHFLTLVAPGSA